MGSSDGVDVVCLHEKQVFFEELIRDGSPMLGMVFMSVYASKFDGFPIDKENSVLELGVAKADSLLDCAVWGREEELVEVGGFSCPFMGIRDREVEHGCRSRRGGYAVNLGPGSVKEFQYHVCCCIELNPNRESSILVFRI